MCIFISRQSIILQSRNLYCVLVLHMVLIRESKILWSESERTILKKIIFLFCKKIVTVLPRALYFIQHVVLNKICSSKNLNYQNVPDVWYALLVHEIMAKRR
jgi:hypothetical protein